MRKCVHISSEKLAGSPVAGLVGSRQEKCAELTRHLCFVGKVPKECVCDVLKVVVKDIVAGCHVDETSTKFDNGSEDYDSHPGNVASPICALGNDGTSILPCAVEDLPLDLYTTEHKVSISFLSSRRTTVRTHLSSTNGEM